jgi:hypothetical protein
MTKIDTADALAEAVQDAAVDETDEVEAERAADEAEDDAAERLELELEGGVGLEGQPEVDTEMLDVFLRRSGVLESEGEARVEDDAELVPPPLQPDEFACAGCNLVKHRSVLGDASRHLCRDCVDAERQTA